MVCALSLLQPGANTRFKSYCEPEPNRRSFTQALSNYSNLPRVFVTGHERKKRPFSVSFIN